MASHRLGVRLPGLTPIGSPRAGRTPEHVRPAAFEHLQVCPPPSAASAADGPGNESGSSHRKAQSLPKLPPAAGIPPLHLPAASTPPVSAARESGGGSSRGSHSTGGGSSRGSHSTASVGVEWHYEKRAAEAAAQKRQRQKERHTNSRPSGRRALRERDGGGVMGSGGDGNAGGRGRRASLSLPETPHPSVFVNSTNSDDSEGAMSERGGYSAGYSHSDIEPESPDSPGLHAASGGELVALSKKVPRRERKKHSRRTSQHKQRRDTGIDGYGSLGGGNDERAALVSDDSETSTAGISGGLAAQWADAGWAEHELGSLPPSDLAAAKFGGQTISGMCCAVLMATVLLGTGSGGFWALPRLLQQCGLLPGLLALAFGVLLAGFGVTLVAEAALRVSRNTHRERRAEFVVLCRYFLGRWAGGFLALSSWVGIVAEGALCLCRAAVAVDALLGAAVGGVPALWLGLGGGDSATLELRTPLWLSTQCAQEHCLPHWGGADAIFQLSLGAIVVYAGALRAARGSLSEMMTLLQVMLALSALAMLGLTLLQLLDVWVEGGDDSSKAAGQGTASSHLESFGPNWSLAPVLVAAFGGCTAVAPSWLDERAEGVRVNKVAWRTAAGLCGALATFGMIGAWSCPTLLAADTGTQGVGLGGVDGGSFLGELLGGRASSHVANSPRRVTALVLFGCSAFAAAPVLFCVARLNLVCARVCSTERAFFFASVPSVLVALFAAPHEKWLLRLQSISTSANLITFCAPFVIAFCALRRAHAMHRHEFSIIFQNSGTVQPTEVAPIPKILLKHQSRLLRGLIAVAAFIVVVCAQRSMK